MLQGLPSRLCQQRGMQECFKGTATECIVAAQRSTKACLREMETEIPALLSMPEDGRLFGAKVGECAAGRTASRFIGAGMIRAELLSSCQDPDFWLSE
jgi:hypothetical protein